MIDAVTAKNNGLTQSQAYKIETTKQFNNVVLGREELDVIQAAVQIVYENLHVENLSETIIRDYSYRICIKNMG